MSNWIVTIGFLGVKRCYLNIDEEEAKRRYKEYENCSDEDLENVDIEIINFDEEFGAYDIWENEN